MRRITIDTFLLMQSTIVCEKMKECGPPISDSEWDRHLSKIKDIANRMLIINGTEIQP